MNNEARKNFILLSGLLFFFFFTWSSCFSLFAIWLEQKIGLSRTAIGGIYSAISMVALCVQPIYGFIQDKLGLKKDLLFFLGILLFLSGPFFIFVLPPLLMFNYILGTAIGGLFIGMTFNAGIGVLECYTERASRVEQFEFGHSRMWGSMGWAAATFIAGHFINIDPRINFCMASVSALIFLLLYSQLSVNKSNALGELEYGKTSAITLFDAFNILKLPKFWALVVFALGVTSVYNVYDQQFQSYFAQQFATIELGNQMYGTLNSVQVFLEAAGMLLAPVIVNYVGAKNGLLISGMVMAIRIIGSGLVDGALMISIMKMLHAVELPIMLIALFKYISLNFEHRLSATVFLVGYQFTTQFSASILSPLAGKGYDSLGFANTYLILGFIVLFFVIVSSFLLQGQHPNSSVQLSPTAK